MQQTDRQAGRLAEGREWYSLTAKKGKSLVSLLLLMCHQSNVMRMKEKEEGIVKALGGGGKRGREQRAGRERGRRVERGGAECNEEKEEQEENEEEEEEAVVVEEQCFTSCCSLGELRVQTLSR